MKDTSTHLLTSCLASHRQRSKMAAKHVHFAVHLVKVRVSDDVLKKYKETSPVFVMHVTYMKLFGKSNDDGGHAQHFHFDVSKPRSIGCII